MSTSAPDHSRFPALDGVRAIATFAVIGTHAAYWTGRYERGPASGLLARLDIGVAVFFALSGFLLIRPWLKDAAGGVRRTRTATYFWHRVIRILPMYWITVGAALLLLPDNDNAGVADWLRHFGLIQIYQYGWFRQGLTQTWSLCTEVAFYLVLPAFGAAAVWWSRRVGWRPVHLLVGCGLLASVSVVWVLITDHATWNASLPTAFWLPGYLSWFAAGMAVAVVQVDVESGGGSWPRMRAAAASPGVCLTMALALFVVSATPVAGPRAIGVASSGTALTKNLLYAAVAVLIMLPCVLGASRSTLAVLGNRPLRWLGRISYSMFLVHLLVLEGVVRLLGYPLFTGSAGQVFLLTSAGTIAVSALTYRFVELPALSLRRRVPLPEQTRPPEPVAADSAATPAP